MKNAVRPVCLNCDLARWDVNEATGRVRLYGAHRCGIDPKVLATEMKKIWPSAAWSYSIDSALNNIDSPRTVLRITREKDEQRDCSRFVQKVST